MKRKFYYTLVFAITLSLVSFAGLKTKDHVNKCCTKQLKTEALLESSTEADVDAEYELFPASPLLFSI